MHNRTIARAGLALSAAALLGFALCVFAGREYGKTIFFDDVSVGSWAALSGTASNAYYVADGTYTNATRTNYYRLSYTNLLGRGPGLALTFVFTGNTNADTTAGTNAVKLRWDATGGAASYIVERSLDAGATWSNWLVVAASATNWIDYGTNSWTATIYTNLYTALGTPSVPWGTTSEVTALQARVTSNETTLAVHSTGKVDQAALDASSNAALHVNGDNVMLATLHAGTNVIDQVSKLVTKRVGDGAGDGATMDDYSLALGYGTAGGGNLTEAVAVGRNAGYQAIGAGWNAFGYWVFYDAVCTNSLGVGRYAGRRAIGNNRLYIDVYDPDPSYFDDGATNDCIFRDTDGVLFLGTGPAHAALPSAGGVLRGSWVGSFSSLSCDALTGRGTNILDTLAAAMDTNAQQWTAIGNVSNLVGGGVVQVGNVNGPTNGFCGPVLHVPYLMPMRLTNWYCGMLAGTGYVSLAVADSSAAVGTYSIRITNAAFGTTGVQTTGLTATNRQTVEAIFSGLSTLQGTNVWRISGEWLP